MPLEIAVSGAVDGEKTNARSFRAPSLFTSPFTRGEYGDPDDTRRIDVTSTQLFGDHVSDPLTEWRRSKSLLAHPSSFGFPEVGADEKPLCANPPPPNPPPAPPNPPPLENED